MLVKAEDYLLMPLTALIKVRAQCYASLHDDLFLLKLDIETNYETFYKVNVSRFSNLRQEFKIF